MRPAITGGWWGWGGEGAGRTEYDPRPEAHASLISHLPMAMGMSSLVSSDACLSLVGAMSVSLRAPLDGQLCPLPTTEGGSAGSRHSFTVPQTWSEVTCRINVFGPQFSQL